MDSEYMEPHIHFIIALEYLLSPLIQYTDLDFIHFSLSHFVDKVSQIYPKQLMLSGMHELLHLVELTKNFGNINSINLFTFETLNRHVSNTIHGKYLVGEEFISSYTLLQGLSSLFRP